VSKPIAAKAKNHETPKAFFDWCVSHYSPKNEVILQRLFDQFQKMSLDKASNMEDYLSKLELTQERITAAGGELSDSQLKAKTMNGLSTKFNTFKTTYNIVGKSADTFETLSRLLLNEEYNLGQLKDANTVAHVQSNPSNDEKKRDGSNNKQEKERVRCDVCRLLHAKTECLVKIEKIPVDWSENAKKRLQARIDEYVANGRKPFPIVVASIDKSESERDSSDIKNKLKGQNIINTILTIDDNDDFEPICYSLFIKKEEEDRDINSGYLFNTHQSSHGFVKVFEINTLSEDDNDLPH